MPLQSMCVGIVFRCVATGGRSPLLQFSVYTGSSFNILLLPFVIQYLLYRIYSLAVWCCSRRASDPIRALRLGHRSHSTVCVYAIPGYPINTPRLPRSQYCMHRIVPHPFLFFIHATMFEDR